MKIRNEKDVSKLDQKIQDELGIDIKLYRNPEVIANVVEMIAFPKFVVKWISRPILISFLLFIAGFFVIELYHILYVIYGIFGLIFFLLCGLTSGILVVILKIRKDIYDLVSYMLDVLKKCVTDARDVHVRMKDSQKASSVLGLLFLGLTHIVFIPTATGVINKKIPKGGFISKWLVKKVLRVVTNRIKFKDIEEDPNAKGNTNDKVGGALQRYIKIVDGTKSVLQKIISGAFSVVEFPVIIAFGICFLWLASFIWMIY